MPDAIFGREVEQKILKELLHSSEAELILILGRQRVGKTFLARNFFHKQLVFKCTGIHDAGLSK
ncbi:MAG: hypothetical protein NTW29_10460 [Bacteroidetes bacterium]|nr:hypothetical protein [Bacteroidota bacterium]